MGLITAISCYITIAYFGPTPIAPIAHARLIYLLTDGEFPAPTQVMQAIDSHNRRAGVRINTYQYGDDEPAAATLRRIAEESGGEYVIIRN